MPKLSDTKEAIARSLTLAPKDGNGALRILEEALAEARATGDTQAVYVLALNAGIVCSGFVDARKALGFYREALRVTPDDAHLYFACGELHRGLGEHDEAKRAFLCFIDNASEQEDMDMIEAARQAIAGL